MGAGSTEIHIGPPRLKTAVQAVVWLAKSGQMISSALIADQIDTHATFIRRIMQSLNNAGIVDSKGGREGGYFLKKPADQITIGDIYQAVAGSHATSEVTIEIDCEDPQKRIDAGDLDTELEKILKEAEAKTIDHLKDYTVAYLAEKVRYS